jgi:hypothetical protein
MIVTIATITFNDEPRIARATHRQIWWVSVKYTKTCLGTWGYI